MFNWSLFDLVASIPGLVIALVIHEYAHARVAVWLGDLTPKLMGRVTLNPKAHIDPIGLIMLFLVRFGWAKPVVINPNNFRNPKRDDILVSLAGPASNLLITFITMFLLMLGMSLNIDISSTAYRIMEFIIRFNVNFAAFNMIPLPPLDGSHILSQLLPPNLAYKYRGLEAYSMFIFIGLMFSGILYSILVPITHFILTSFESIIYFSLMIFF